MVAERGIWDVRHGGDTAEKGGEEEESSGAKKVGEEESIVNDLSMFCFVCCQFRLQCD